MNRNCEPSVYYLPVIKEIRRLISWQDREPFSSTYGSFDRTYWCWKFTDFPGARFQEGTYALAYLFCKPFPGNCFAENKIILQWALAGMNFWRIKQYRDGSFDEAYPFEHSLAATAFTSFYAGEAFRLLENYIPKKDREVLCNAFSRAGNWLCVNDERHGILSNHLAAAAAALESIYRICGDMKYRKRSKYFLGKIYKHQSGEGWYEEYSGADPGYQTHCTFYLAWIWKSTGDTKLLESLKHSIDFLKYFIHPNGTLGGEYGSRNTEFYFPAGFEILAHVIPEAASIARFMRQSVAVQNAAGLAAMDVYNYLPMLNNYLFAAGNTKDLHSSDVELPCKSEVNKYFPSAGLYVKSTSVYYCVLGLSKGGVLKGYDRKTGKLVASDCGYWAELYSGKVVTSQSLNNLGQWKESNNAFNVVSDFILINNFVQTPILFIGFRIYTLTLGRLQSAAYWIKNLLVRMLIQRRKKVPMRLSRQICFKEREIIVSDRIEMTGKLNVRILKHGTKFASIHMGSSRYFQEQELDKVYNHEQNWAEHLVRSRKVGIEHTFSFV